MRCRHLAGSALAIHVAATHPRGRERSDLRTRRANLASRCRRAGATTRRIAAEPPATRNYSLKHRNSVLMHPPLQQYVPDPQTCPHEPQFRLFDRVSTSQPSVPLASQSAKPVLQLYEHNRKRVTHDPEPLGTGGHSQPFVALKSQFAKPAL